MTVTEIKLDYSVESNGMGLDVLSLRRPRIGDLLKGEKADGSDAAKEVALFARLCDVEINVIESLDMSDYLKLQEAYQGFLS